MRVIKSLGYIVIFIVIVIFINIVYSKLVLSNTILQRVDDQFDLYKNEVRILFLGDSHSRRSLNPAHINESFNFSSEGENYFQTYHKFKKLIESRAVEPKIVILPIDLHSFSSFRKGIIKDEWYWKKYVNFTDLWDLFGTNYTIQKSIMAISPVMGNGNVLAWHILNKVELTGIYKGYIFENFNYSLEKNKDEIARKRATHHFDGSVIIDTDLFMDFQKSLDLAQKNNIKVFLVKFPVSEQYVNEVNRYFNINDFNDKIMIVANSYSNVKVLDYQKIYFNKPEFFMDSDHLNRMGADDFTILIKNDLMLK